MAKNRKLAAARRLYCNRIKTWLMSHPGMTTKDARQAYRDEKAGKRYGIPMLATGGAGVAKTGQIDGSDRYDMAGAMTDAFEALRVAVNLVSLVGLEEGLNAVHMAAQLTQTKASKPVWYRKPGDPATLMDEFN